MVGGRGGGAARVDVNYLNPQRLVCEKCVCPSGCIFGCLSVIPLVCVSIAGWLSVRPCGRLSNFLSFSLVCRSGSPSVGFFFWFVYLSAHLFVRQIVAVCLSVRLV